MPMVRDRETGKIVWMDQLTYLDGLNDTAAPLRMRTVITHEDAKGNVTIVDETIDAEEER